LSTFQQLTLSGQLETAPSCASHDSRSDG
jgi:hypothetical protein